MGEPVLRNRLLQQGMDTKNRRTTTDLLPLPKTEEETIK